MNENLPNNRYQRQTILKGFGEAGQQKLLATKVLVVGAGGLGCPALQYLAAAGVGHIGIVDDDNVALSNLQRQVIYKAEDIGHPKAEKAAATLQQLNNEIIINPYNIRLTTSNALALINTYDIIIDGTDNFVTRYTINDACVLLNKPLVYGAISMYEGQVAIFNYKKVKTDEAVNYRDLFPQPPKDGEVMNCAEAGVLGVLPGIIGTMMANETIKLITGIGVALINKLFTYNALNNQTYEIQLSANLKTRFLIPATAQAFAETNYEWLCAATLHSLEIDTATFDYLIKNNNITIVDVRETDELPSVNEFHHLQIPLQQLLQNTDVLSSETIVLFCQSGKRSLQGALQLNDILGASKKIHSLQKGIVHWKEQKRNKWKRNQKIYL